MWIVPSAEPDNDNSKISGVDKRKNVNSKQKDSGKGSKTNRAKETSQQQQLQRIREDNQQNSTIVPDISDPVELSEKDDNKMGTCDGEDEDWVDVPINTSKPSVTFDDSIEMRDEDYEPPSDNSPSSITHKEGRDKNKKKEKETSEQRKARLTRKAQAKKQKELEEQEQRKAFEERLKASEMAARLQAEENERIQRSKEESAAMARLDEADWVVHTKKVDRRVKTFEELLEERIAKEAALAEANKNKNAATLKAVAGSNELPNDKPDSRSGKSSSKSSNSNSNKNDNDVRYQLQ